MDRRQTLVMLIKAAMESTVAAARATAPDKLTWSPDGKARSVLAQLTECGQACEWFASVLNVKGEGVAFDPESFAAAGAAQLAATDLDVVEADVRRNTDAFCEAITNLPAESGATVVEIFPNFSLPLDKLMILPLENFAYHQGQINYIQTMYGDKDMHEAGSAQIAFPDRETIVEICEFMMGQLVRTVRATPADKMKWSPAEGARTILDMAEEVRQSGGWGAGSLETADKFSFADFDFEQMMADRLQEPNNDEWETRLRANHEEFYAKLRAFPAEKEGLRAEPMPGWVLTMGDLAYYPFWNITYHLGQINYVQCLYGDHEMH